MGSLDIITVNVPAGGGTTSPRAGLASRILKQRSSQSKIIIFMQKHKYARLSPTVTKPNAVLPVRRR